MNQRRDLRAYTRSTTSRLILGGALILVILGNGLVLWIYGWEAALQSLLCMAAFLIPIGLIAIVLFLMEWVVKKNRES